MTTTFSTPPKASLGVWRRLFYRGPAIDELYDEYAVSAAH